MSLELEAMQPSLAPLRDAASAALCPRSLSCASRPRSIKEHPEPADRLLHADHFDSAVTAAHANRGRRTSWHLQFASCSA